MICERCQESKGKVHETRTHISPKGYHFVRRRQTCLGCGFEFTTIEVEQTIFGALDGYNTRRESKEESNGVVEEV